MVKMYMVLLIKTGEWVEGVAPDGTGLPEGSTLELGDTYKKNQDGNHLKN